MNAPFTNRHEIDVRYLTAKLLAPLLIGRTVRRGSPSNESCGWVIDRRNAYCRFIAVRTFVGAPGMRQLEKRQIARKTTRTYALSQRRGAAACLLGKSSTLRRDRQAPENLNTSSPPH
ncbi:hypothetical protein [Bradyrhizobium sp. USDA 223]|uniref:hypothetical protein n=1 Tax=Bradyrhizobium sp. USDA 223 TaxID=3156306 RepID=UPI0038369BDB